MRNVLITNDEIIFHAPTAHTLDYRTIQQSIIVAEERFIRPALCHAFYQELIAEKNKEVVAGNITALQAEINSSIPSGSDPITLVEGNIVNSYKYLSAANQKIWKEYLWKLTAECVMVLSLPEAFVHFTTEGAVHKAPGANSIGGGNVFSPELRTMKWARDTKLFDRIDPLIQAMHIWICGEKTTTPSVYANYSKECDCDSSGNSYKKKNDLVLNLYDDDETSTSCCQ